MRADHRVLVAATMDRHAEEVAGLKRASDRLAEEIAALTTERDEIVQAVAEDFEEDPSEHLHELIENEVVADLQRQLDGAYRSRDRAMAAVWRVDALHHADGSEKCRCGSPLRSCRTYQALEFYRETYYAWERRQIESMKNGKAHGLPRDHPESRMYDTDPYRSWRGRPPTKQEDERGGRR